MEFVTKEKKSVDCRTCSNESMCSCLSHDGKAQGAAGTLFHFSRFEIRKSRPSWMRIDGARNRKPRQVRARQW